MQSSSKIRRYIPDLKNNPIELAEEIKRYKDEYPDVTRRDIADAYTESGLKSESSYQYVSILLKIGNWPDDVLRFAEKQAVSWNRLRELSRLDDIAKIRSSLGIENVIPIRSKEEEQKRVVAVDTPDTYRPEETKKSLKKTDENTLSKRVFLRLVVLFTTALMIYSTGEALGGELLDYARASVIDLAILAFIMNMPGKGFLKYLCIAAVGALSFASFSILHSGAKISALEGKEVAQREISESATAQSGVQSYQRQLDQVLAEIESLPASYATQRTKKRAEARELQNLIDQSRPQKEAFKTSIEKFETKEDAEVLMRGLYLLINIIGSLLLRFGRGQERSANPLSPAKAGGRNTFRTLFRAMALGFASCIRRKPQTELQVQT